jgi:hypothetical protein
MVLRAAQDVSALIAKKSYAKAIDLIKEQLKTQRSDPRLRMQLADVLVMAGKGKEAVMILTPLADEFAREGFAAKAIAVLKRIQKIDPARREVEAKLASLIQEKQQQATASVAITPPPAPPFEIGMEEIGFEPPPGGPIVVPSDDRPAPLPPPAHEIGFEAEPIVEAQPTLPAEPVAPAAPAVPATPAPPPVSAEPARPAGTPAASARPELVIEEAGIELEAEPEPVPIVAPEPAEPAPAEPERPVILLEPALVVEPEPMVPVADAVEPEFVLDDDEAFQLEGEPAAAEEELSAEPVAVEGEPITDGLFVDELMSVLEEAFPSGLEAPISEPVAAGSSGAAQIVVSPLFRHFSVDEMVAVIAGLHLVSYERGQVVIREGEAGNSLFMLSSGKVKAFKKTAAGKQVPIAELEEGAFFGEGSILTGKPRAASIVATTPCELLELDRPTLDSICQTHPHVMDVLREFAAQRAAAGRK